MTTTALVIDRDRFSEKTKRVFEEIDGKKKAFWPAEVFLPEEVLEAAPSLVRSKMFFRETRIPDSWFAVLEFGEDWYLYEFFFVPNGWACFKKGFVSEVVEVSEQERGESHKK